jgi:hypothetical protein
VRLHVAKQATLPFEPSRRQGLRAAMAAAYATAVGGDALSALLLTHVSVMAAIDTLASQKRLRLSE